MDRPEPEMGTQKEVLAERVVAVIIDTIIMFLLIVSTFSVGILGAPAGPFLFMTLMGGGIILTFFYAFFLEGYMGQTIGKKIMGIVVVKKDGSPCDYLASFVRNLLRIVDVLPQAYLVGLIVILVTEKRQRIGDLVANTFVVKIE